MKLIILLYCNILIAQLGVTQSYKFIHFENKLLNTIDLIYNQSNIAKKVYDSQLNADSILQITLSDNIVNKDSIFALENMPNYISASFIKLNTEFIDIISNFKANNISVLFLINNQTVTLDLILTPLISDDFKLKTNNSENVQKINFGLHYQGIIRGTNSIACINIFKNEISGYIQNSELGSINISKLSSNSNVYIIYTESQFNAWTCGLLAPIDVKPFSLKINKNRTILPCIKLFWETRYDLYTLYNSDIQNLSNYIFSIFNIFNLLYSNEGIGMNLNTLFVWTTPDPYIGCNSNNLLDVIIGYNSIRTNFDPCDLAHLLMAGGGENGISAGWGGICDNSINYTAYGGQLSPHAVSRGIDDPVLNFPNYSWPVFVTAHETGHNLGSWHTHDCVWNNNNTQIDDCGNYMVNDPPDCYIPNNPILPACGTIMSYCNRDILPNSEICFSEGFGAQPSGMIQAVTEECITYVCDNPQNTCFDDFEPNNTFSNATNFFATPLGNGMAQNCENANIGYLDDIDWFKVTLTTPGALNIQLTTLPYNYNIELYGPNGPNDPAIAGSYNSGTQNEIINFQYTQNISNNYYIKIYSFNPNNYSNASCYALCINWNSQNADLIIQNPSVSPTSILPGQQGTVYCKNKNQGNTTAGTSWTAVWLSQDQDFDGAPTDINLNADMPVPQLTAGQISSLLSHSITIPSGTPCGTWYIMFGADALDNVDEATNENNNNTFIPITISCPLMCNNDYSCGPPEPPFLTIYSTCINTSCSTVGAHPPSPDIPIVCGGNQYQSGRYDDDVWFRITPSTTDELTITVTPTSNLSNFDPVIGLYHGACLTPVQDGCADLHPEGISEELIFTPVIGNTYLIRVFGYDIGGGYSGNFNICVVTEGSPAPPDLVINNISLSDYTLCDDQDFSISYTIQNIGGELAPASTVKFYLSTNNTYGASDDLLGSQSVSDLEIGESLNKTKSFSIPVGTDPDDWFILVLADANEVVDEGIPGEENNLDAIPIEVLNCGGVADLIISYDSHSPVLINPGTNVIMNYTAENIGTADAPSCRIGIYTSEDNVFNANTDEYIDDWFQTPLDEGEIDIEDLSFQVPDCHQCGTFYIFILIDYQHVISESNENNNEDNFEIDITGCTNCTYSVPPTGINFQSSGGSGSFNVTTTQCCPWEASTTNSWITLTQSTGIGSGIVQYTVDPCNNGSTRTGIVTVENQNHQITQTCIESCNESQSFEWATQAGSATLSDGAADIAIDGDGNLYMTGNIQGSANFGNGIILTTPSTAPDVFVSKHNASGEIQWAVNYGNTGQERAYAIEVDNDGYIYVIGDFKNTVDFGGISLTSNNQYESAFLIKLDSNGEIIWAKIVNQEFTARPGDLALDSIENIYIAGDLDDHVGNFDDGIFVSKFNQSGTQLSYFTYGSSIYVKQANGITLDNTGNIYIAGRYLQTITLGSYTLTSDGTLDMNGFIAKIDQSGLVLWAKRLNSPGQGDDNIWSLTSDTSNNIYVLACIDSNAVYENLNIPLSAGSKLLIFKIDQNGIPYWMKASTVGYQANRQRINLGDDNEIYFCGYFADSMHIDSFEIAGISGEAYMGRIDQSGKIGWLRGFGGDLSDAASGIETNQMEVFVAGSFRSTVEFDDAVLTSYGNADIFIAKYIQCDLPPIELTLTGDTVICNGSTSTISTEFCSEITYQWYKDSTSIPGANDPYFIVTEPGQYKVKISAYSGCEVESEDLGIYSSGTYTFTGNGLWTNPANWYNSIIPPLNPPDCYEIIIDHLPGGSCNLYTATEFNPGINVTVMPGKFFYIYQE